MNQILLCIMLILGANTSVLIVCMIGALVVYSQIINILFFAQLGRVIEMILIPCVIFVNVLKTFVFEDLLSIFPIAFSAVLLYTTGQIVAIIINKIWIKDNQNGYMVKLACSNPHSVAIQLQLTYSLQVLMDQQQTTSHFESTTKTTTRAITSIMIFSIAIQTLRWASEKMQIKKKSQSDKKIDEFQKLQTPLIDSFIDDLSNQSALTCENDELSKNSICQKDTYSKKAKLRKFLKLITQVPAHWFAFIISIILVAIQPIQENLLDKESFLSSALLTPIDTLARACLPCALIKLGADLYLILQSRQQRLKEVTIKNKIPIIISLTKLILVPMAGMGVLYFSVRYKILVDPAVIFVTFLTYITPTDISLMHIAIQNVRNLDSVTQTMVYSYFGSIFTIPVWIIVYFWVVNI